MKNELVVIAEKSGLEKNKIETLVGSFDKYFQEAKAIVAENKNIVVNDEKDTVGMEQARSARLALQKVRVAAEKTRVALKESSRREGLAIDGINNVLKALIVPVENHLKIQEKYAEFIAEERANKIYEERVNELSKYVEDVCIYSLKHMSEDVFKELRDRCKKAKDDKIEAEKRAKEEATQKELAYQKEQEQIRLDNIKLRKEAKEREEAAEIERQKQAKALQSERDKIEKIEAKIREEKEAEAKKKNDELLKQQAEQKAKDEIERQKLLAPDKEKLIDLASTIDKISMPAVSTKGAQKITAETKDILLKLSGDIRKQASNMN